MPPAGSIRSPAPAAEKVWRVESTAVAEMVLRRAAQGLGLPAEALARQDPGALVEELGALVRLAVGELKALLEDRADAMRGMRSQQHTAIKALDNNPLKFSPTAEHALALLLSAGDRSYLSGEAALGSSFADVRNHQRKLMAGAVGALQALARDLDPKEIEGRVSGGGLLSSSRKARLWDQYVALWKKQADADALSSQQLRLLGDGYDKSA